MLILGGRPIREPVAWMGPFVMNTREEVLQAVADYQAGRLGSIPAVHNTPTTLIQTDARPRRPSDPRLIAAARRSDQPSGLDDGRPRPGPSTRSSVAGARVAHAVLKRTAGRSCGPPHTRASPAG